MAVSDTKCSVWDWERFAPGVPVGYDALHLFLMSHASVGSHDLTSLPVDLFDNAERTAPPLRRDGPRSGRAVTTAGYLLELAGRYLDDNQAEAGARLGAVGEWLLPLPVHETDAPRVTSLGARSEWAVSGTVKGAGRRAALVAADQIGHRTASRRVLPDMLIVGGQRCGTTTLFKALAQHDAFLGPTLRKGVHYFDLQSDQSLDWYRSHFPTRGAVENLQRNRATAASSSASPVRTTCGTPHRGANSPDTAGCQSHCSACAIRSNAPTRPTPTNWRAASRPNRSKRRSRSRRSDSTVRRNVSARRRDAKPCPPASRLRTARRVRRPAASAWSMRSDASRCSSSTAPTSGRHRNATGPQ